MMEIGWLCDLVRQTGFELHVYLGHGHMEKVYENGMVHRLRKAGLRVEQQVPIQVHDEDGTVIGDYVADILVDDQLILELKTAKAIAPEHEAQILGYLKATQIEHGMIINFGAYRYEVRKFAWSGARKAGSLAVENSKSFAAENAKNA